LNIYLDKASCLLKTRLTKIKIGLLRIPTVLFSAYTNKSYPLKPQIGLPLKLVIGDIVLDDGKIIIGSGADKLLNDKDNEKI